MPAAARPNYRLSVWVARRQDATCSSSLHAVQRMLRSAQFSSRIRTLRHEFEPSSRRRSHRLVSNVSTTRSVPRMTTSSPVTIASDGGRLHDAERLLVCGAHAALPIAGASTGQVTGPAHGGAE